MSIVGPAKDMGVESVSTVVSSKGLSKSIGLPSVSTSAVIGGLFIVVSSGGAEGLGLAEALGEALELGEREGDILELGEILGLGLIEALSELEGD